MAECQVSMSNTIETEKNETNEKETEILCQLCQEEGLSLKAKGYCLDCRDYLCETCFDSHCRPRPLRTHRLRKVEELSVSEKEIKNDKNDDDISQLVCKIHDGNVILSYCGSHGQFCCERCLSIGHVACKDLTDINKLTNEIDNQSEFKSFCASMDYFKTKWKTEKKRALSNLDDVNRSYETTVSFVTSKLDEMKKADNAYIDSVLSACESTISQLEKWRADVEDFKSKKQIRKLLHLMQTAQSQLVVMDEYIHTSFGKSQITRYCIGNVQPSETSIITIAKTPFMLKTLNVEVVPPRSYFAYSNQPKKDPVKSHISDIHCFNKTHLLAANQSRNMIHLIKATGNQVITSHNVNGSPLQMSIGEHNDVYCNMGVNIVHLQQQDNKLGFKNGDNIQTKTQYHTIDYYNQKLKVIGGKPLQLAELTLDGKLDRIVNKDLSQTKDADGQSLISSVSFSTVDKSTGSVFVPGNNSIVEIKNDGTVELFAYSELLKSPQNIRVLEDSSLLVASRENKNVYRVYRSGHVSSVLPEPLDFPVVAIGYDTEERRLFVGGESDNVSVYQL
ncbi:uncharacterized protein LOC128244857 [Mya arenaria]|uniref:uncharacterized protein LOC128244857 n=1 Tax=Mya arenaria TaxID=6604 RepID=UPI0022E012DD|nr:uncharacterized protein LOC128244857 [Mya arenaria]